MNNNDFQKLTLDNLINLNSQVGEIKGQMTAYHSDSNRLSSNWTKTKILIPLAGLVPSIIAIALFNLDFLK